MKMARFTVRALDVGFVVTEERLGHNRFGDEDWLLDGEVACVDEAAVEEVLDKWDWQKAVGLPKKKPFLPDLQVS